jgi:RimJ/RimL family protein N-acetyltransferase
VRGRLDVIETDRLRLTPLTVQDADAMVQVLADPALYTFIGGGPPSLEQLRQQYRRWVVGRSEDGAQDWFNWIVRLRNDGQPVGTVQATVFDGGTRGEIAWVIGVPWQGNGFAREATVALAGWLRDRRVASLTAHVHPDHLASAAVARAAGLAPTGETYDGEQRWASGPPNGS